MINLLMKDLKLLFASETNTKKRIISSIFNVLIFICFVSLETFLFTKILQKIKIYKNAPIAFFTLFLFIISILMIFLGLIQAKKLLFNKKDIEQLTYHPIKNSQIILSKLFFLFLIHYATGLLFTYPLFLSYGIIFKKMTIFYYLALFYPLLTFFFEIGIALIFVFPYKLLTDYLKQHLILQFIVAIVLLFAFCYAYSKVLTVFITLVANNNLDALFNVTSINQIIKMRKFFIPVNFLVDMFLLSSSSSVLPFVCIAFGIFLMGVCISIAAFNYFRKLQIQKSKVNMNAEHTLKQTSITKALIKKELILITKNSSYIFSFTGLLIIQPFLVFLVISALNTIFRSGLFLYYTAILPNFVPLLDILLIMMFTLIINQGANNYISMEEKNIRLMKMIPVNPKKQLLIKVMIPFVCSTVSLLLSLILFLSTQIISLKTFLFGFILTMMVLTIFNIVSLLEELKIKRNKPKNIFWSTFYSYLLPFIFFFVSLLLSFFKVNIYVVFVISMVIIALIGLPFIIALPKKVNRLFLELEVVN